MLKKKNRNETEFDFNLTIKMASNYFLNIHFVLFLLLFTFHFDLTLQNRNHTSINFNSSNNNNNNNSNNSNNQSSELLRNRTATKNLTYFAGIRDVDIKTWAAGFSRDIHLIAKLATCEDQLSKSFRDRGAIVKKRKTDETLKKIGSDINKLFNKRREIVTNLVKDAEREAVKYSLELMSKKTIEDSNETDEETVATTSTSSVASGSSNEAVTSFSKSIDADEEEEEEIANTINVISSEVTTTNSANESDSTQWSVGNEDEVGTSSVLPVIEDTVTEDNSIHQTDFSSKQSIDLSNEITPRTTDERVESSENNQINANEIGATSGSHENEHDNEIGIADNEEPDYSESKSIEGNQLNTDSLSKQVRTDNKLVEKIYRKESAYLQAKNAKSARRPKRSTTVSVPDDEISSENSETKANSDALFPQQPEVGVSDPLASEQMPELLSRSNEEAFVAFRDLKKIYEPNRKLTNYSIPRAVDPSENSDDSDEQLEYERWKSWAPVETVTDPMFPNYELNFSFSGLHVPLNVFPQHNNTRNAIKWSASLDHSFRRNRLLEPNLNFQFFCSIDGFLRIFPLIKWRVPNLFSTAEKYNRLYTNNRATSTINQAQLRARRQALAGRVRSNNKKSRPEAPSSFVHHSGISEGEDDPDLEVIELPEVSEEDMISDDEVDENDPSRSLDLYDCRMRDWFIKAAAPAKDIIVLADSSGSMRGERSKIAQNVIINILETLTENDFVSVLRFSSNVFDVHPCFGTRFVQADKRNVARFKDEILEMSDENRLEEAQKAANFTEAFSVAFRMFEEQSRSQHGSNCIKALMMITDGSQQNLDYVLRQIDNQDRSVRIFVYLIGREVTDTKSPESIACNNFGYFTHLKDLAEVKEEVQLYVPVLSRPIGLHVRDATVVCSSVYADPLLPPLTDMVWEMHENRLFYEIFYRSNSPSESTAAAHLVRRHRSTENRPAILSSNTLLPQVDEPELMVTLAMPVFNMTNGTKTSWDLLGVAGVDIPIRDILKEVPFYRLGVGGYMFIVNNNGFLIYHPDMRPVYKGFLKRFYTALDILELELMDDGRKIREKNPELMAMRNSMVDENTDCAILRAKMHYDSMKRVTTRENHYCWISINETLFTLGIALPNQYGHYYVKATLEMLPGKNYQKYLRLKDSKWFVHPNWHYCWDNLEHEQIRRRQWKEKLLMNMKPEEVIEYFMEINQKAPQRFAWIRFGKESDEVNNTQVEFLCNKELLESFMFDARATKIEPKASLKKLSKTLASKVQIENVFLSTRSGLTRFFNMSTTSSSTKHRIQHRELTIDELIYKRTVEYSVKNHVEHFVFQIESEFDAFPASATWVTIARAFFLQGHPEDKSEFGNQTEGESKIEHVPYMVSGMQITYNSFSELFFQHPKNCDLVQCKIDCFRSDINCYLLDDNGYIVLSVNDFDSSRNLDNRLDKDAGRHLLELDYELFIHMTTGQKPIFRKVEVFDFQGICENPKETAESSASNRFSLNLFASTWKAVGFVSELLLQLGAHLSWSASSTVQASEYEDEEEITGDLNRTVVRACPKIYDLYELNNAESFVRKVALINFTRQFDCDESYYLHKIENSNLIMLISQNDCPKVRQKREPRYPPEVEDCKGHEYMHRKRPHMYEDHMCFPNQEETKIKHCGARSYSLKLHCSSTFTLMISFLILFFFYKCLPFAFK